jgi:hypothetical protein
MSPSHISYENNEWFLSNTLFLQSDAFFGARLLVSEDATDTI